MPNSLKKFMPIPDIPPEEDWEEMDVSEREEFEQKLEQVPLARRHPGTVGVLGKPL